MKTVYKGYPYPVLGNGDDFSGDFIATMECTLDVDQVVLELIFNVDQADIVDLISQQKAQFVVLVECGITFFRKTFTTHDSMMKVVIDSTELRGNVNVSFFVCTEKQLDMYAPSGVHKDLTGGVYVLEKGDVMAVAGTASFTADKDFDPLTASISSFMRISQGKEKSGPMNVDFGGDQILIILSERDFEGYRFAKKHFVEVIHSSMVLPTLIEAFYIVNSNEVDYGNLSWFSRINQICEAQKIDIDQPLVAAQKMLGNPINRALDLLENIDFDSEDE